MQFATSFHGHINNQLHCSRCEQLVKSICWISGSPRPRYIRNSSFSICQILWPDFWLVDDFSPNYFPSPLYPIVSILTGLEKHLRIDHKWCAVYTLVPMLGAWQGLTCTVVIPWSFFSLNCWPISEDNKDSFPNNSCMRKYPFVPSPFALPSVKGWTEAPIHHWLDTGPAWHFSPFWGLLPLNSGPKFTVFCLQLFLLCNLRFSDAVARQVPCEATHTLRTRSQMRSHQGEPLRFQVHQDTKGWTWANSVSDVWEMCSSPLPLGAPSCDRLIQACGGNQ